MIGAMAREEEGGRIRERHIIISSEQDFGIGQVIIKNALIDFLNLPFSDEALPKTKPQLANYQVLMSVAWQSI